jgi:acetolactate synthase-1/2/3 large subunit
MKKKLSDYIAERLSTSGISQVFMVTGGGSMHLNHSLGIHPSLNCVFNHHEQACTMAADSFFRLSGKLAVANVTTGPGGTNAITGVYGAWTDSIGMLVISGQVKWETTAQSTSLPIRQLGDQEINIIDIIRPLTKYALTITDPNSIQYHLDKAIWLAKSGRPGPSWLDIPINIQASMIDPVKLTEFDPSEIEQPWKNTNLTQLCTELVDRIHVAKRPVILAGTGVRISGCVDVLHRVVENLKIPIVTAWNAHDVIPDDHPLYAGRPGTVGTRAGNFAVQNSDLLLILGSRLNIRQVSYEWKSFARAAFKVWVDIDELELNKPTIKPDLAIHSDLRDFLPCLEEASTDYSSTAHQSWVRWVRTRVEQYPVLLEKHDQSKLINPYIFVDTLTKTLEEGDVVVTGDGTACVVTFQAAIIKRNQRFYTNSGCAAMGYDLPAAIGASLAEPGKRIICLAGDGSIMLNLQELQTISSNKLPIMIFLLNNNGYASIAQTFNNYFDGAEIGCTPKSGLSFPNFKNTCYGFRLPYYRIENHHELTKTITDVLASDAPGLCEIMLDPEINFAPKLSSRQLPDGQMTSSPLEDMAPFLERDELKSNMFIPLYDE